MRLRALTVGTAMVAASAFAITAGVQHAAAACPTGVNPGTGPAGATGATVCVALGVNTPLGTVNGAEVWVGADATHGVVYNPTNPTAPVTGVPGAYVIVQGNGNTTCVLPACAEDNGYFGVSNFETGAHGVGPQDVPCGGSAAGSGSNSGGSVGVDPMCGTPLSQGLPLPLACGNVSGTDWTNTPRDGCWEP